VWHIRMCRLARVYPACAGIDLKGITVQIGADSLPRMRGDRPYNFEEWIANGLSTPHARGSTFGGISANHVAIVYPACAGIDPFISGFRQRPSSLPRMRGDRPEKRTRRRTLHMSTPHARGSTPDERRRRATGTVYPACAGIDLSNTK